MVSPQEQFNQSLPEMPQVVIDRLQEELGVLYAAAFHNEDLWSEVDALGELIAEVEGDNTIEAPDENRVNYLYDSAKEEI